MGTLRYGWGTDVALPREGVGVTTIAGGRCCQYAGDSDGKQYELSH